MITPDKKDWHPVEQPPPFNGGGGGSGGSHPAGIYADRQAGVGVMKNARSHKSRCRRSRTQWQRRRHRRRHRGCTWGRPDRRPHPARDPHRTPGGDRVGMDRRRDLVRLDRNARRASGLGAARHRADYPADRPRSRSMGRRRGRGDSTRARGYTPGIDWSKPLTEWPTRDHGRISDSRPRSRSFARP